MNRRRLHPTIRDQSGEPIVYNDCQIHWERMSPESQRAMQELIRAAYAYGLKLSPEAPPTDGGQEEE